MPRFFDEGFGRKVAGLIGDWEGGGGYVTPGGSSGEYAGRTGKEFGGSIWSSVPANRPVRPAVLTGGEEDLLDASRPAPRGYTAPAERPRWAIEPSEQPQFAYQPLRRDPPLEGRPSDVQLAMGIRNQADADLLAASFKHVPVEQIPEGYLFKKGRRALGAGSPRELRSRLRGMTEAQLVESLFGDRTAVDLNTPFGASGTGWGRTGRQAGTAFDDRALMDPAWSIGVQHLEDRLSGGGATREGERVLPPRRRGGVQPSALAALAPTEGGSSIVSPEMMARIRR